jgi:hypothetical protein
VNLTNNENRRTTPREFVEQATAGAPSVLEGSGAGIAASLASQVIEIFPGVKGPKYGKYAKYLRPYFFQDYGSCPFKVGTKADIAFLGHDVCIEYGVSLIQERCIFASPVMWIVPAAVSHLPLIITKAEKPFIMSDCRRFGSGSTGGPRLD